MIDRETHYAIKVTNAFKSYGNTNVLNGLNMNVASGSIYGLLGPSGCGKSTLLQCILNKIELDSGCTDVEASSLSEIGYMPQNLCLDSSLTVKETFQYYGQLFHMTQKQIDNRIEELMKFLQLPDIDSYIGKISGGQCRRVSLGISLLHNPKIIILDEPTVGIDPIVRHEIWLELRKMAEKDKKTIIITTHYIEEANLADCVGLMREGVLVEELAPQDIIRKCNTDSLDSAFLILCTNLKQNQVIHSDIVPEKGSSLDKSKSQRFGRSEKQIDFKRIKAILNKHWTVLSRDFLLMFVVFVLPFSQSFLYCTSVGVPVKNMSIAVKNDEISLLGCKHFNVSGCILDEESNQTMSCVLLKYLESLDYELTEVQNYDANEMNTTHLKYLAFIHFPKNFTREFNVLLDVENREDYNIESQVYMNYRKDNYILKIQILKDLVDSMNYIMENILNSCSISPKVFRAPLDFITIVGNDVKTYTHTILPILIATTSIFFPSSFSLSIMLQERMDGLLDRSMNSGVTAAELLISLFCLTNVVLLIQLAIPLFVAYVVYPNPIIIFNGLIMYSILAIVLGWIGYFSGVIVAGLVPTKVGGVYLINGLFISQYMLSGSLWPIVGQPKFLRVISEYLPMGMVGQTLLDISLKGWSLEHNSVITTTIIIFGYNILLAISLFVLGKIKKDMWVLNK